MIIPQGINKITSKLTEVLDSGKLSNDKLGFLKKNVQDMYPSDISDKEWVILGLFVARGKIGPSPPAIRNMARKVITGWDREYIFVENLVNLVV